MTIEDYEAMRTVNVPGSRYRSSDWIEGGEFILTPAYRSDKENSVRAFEGGLYWKPGVWIPAGLNVRKQIIQNLVSFRWDPMLGMEVGEYSERRGLASPLPRDYFRGFLRVHAELDLGPQDQPPFSLTGDYTFRQQFSDSSTEYNYSEISLLFHVDPDRLAHVATADNRPFVDPHTNLPSYVVIPGHVTIGATWKCGKDAPTFKNVNTFTTWIGLQY